MAPNYKGEIKVVPSQIKNKCKRNEVYAKLKHQKKKEKDNLKKKRQEAIRNGEEGAEKQVPQTLDSRRDANASFVCPQDDEVFQDDVEDEFARFFSNEISPKIMITTRPRPSSNLFSFIADLLQMFPNAFFYPRRHFQMKQICKYAGNKKFTHLMVLSEKLKKCNGMVLCHLPAGPTAYFKVSNVVPSSKISNHGRVSAHQPELILNNFNTRLGHRVGRFLGSLFPHDPEFNGRQVVTFHNQRDFIFIRHHRYMFAEGKKQTKAHLQELGPRFTIRMRWLQEGSFDTQTGEYEW
eukprot:CAMPEP_0113945212 /NCGR_PEP_ID=MMETSP1339-20121228/41382_1 /TAXON_ID=94617 /ORGANISM="Fibrocapsa japonica" /LENGTH=293 /DNA_ID=CAMNT_0000950671 /DNA_START=90 /DNA_END=968 /DNA_ORIENTATION=+ /assembly_acc=CAM_ASM_000762